MDNRNWYDILGVSEQASEKEIKAAFRRISKENHPDGHPGDAVCEERFKAASEAYSILSDKEKRAEYDRALRKEGSVQRTRQKEAEQTVQPGMSEFDFQNINQSFADFFGFRPDTKEIVDESKLSPNQKNPLDAGALFEQFMGIKR